MRLDGEKRLLIAGKTGSGKTFLCRFLLKLMYAAGYRIVIVDPKIDWMVHRNEDGTKVVLPYAEKGPGTVDNPVLLRDYTFRPELRCQIIHPVAWSDPFGAFLTDILYTGNTIIYFDEGTQLVNANFVPIQFLTVVSQGRSKDVGVWYGTQFAVRIPEILKGQSTYIIMMRIARKHREELATYMNVDERPELLEQPLPQRYFWLYDDEKDSITLYAPLEAA